MKIFKSEITWIRQQIVQKNPKYVKSVASNIVSNILCIHIKWEPRTAAKFIAFGEYVVQ